MIKIKSIQIYAYRSFPITTVQVPAYDSDRGIISADYYRCAFIPIPRTGDRTPSVMN